MTNTTTPQNDEPIGQQEATNLVRQRIDAIYKQRTQELDPAPKKDLLQRFWESHSNDQDHNAAWEQFYASLPDDQKQQLWNEYHHTQLQEQAHIEQVQVPPSPNTSAHEQDNAPISSNAPHHPSVDDQKPDTKDTHTEPSATPTASKGHKKHFATFYIPGSETEQSPPEPLHAPSPAPVTDNPVSSSMAIQQPIEAPETKSVAQTKHQLLQSLTSQAQGKAENSGGLRRWKAPAWSALVTIALVVLLNYNQVAIASVKKYVSPGDSLRSPIIVDPNAAIDIGKESKIIIPKINVDVPVVYDITSYKDADIQKGLERGVVHYGETALPGQVGNNVIVGHSSSNFFNPGKYKFAFVLLDRMELNDTFILHYDGVRYVYKVTNIQTIQPNDFSLIQPTANPTTTLITCSPPGTNWKRLVIQGEQISPDPSKARKSNQSPAQQTDSSTNLPGNAPSLWDRVIN